MLLALRPQRFPDRLAIVGRHVDLEAALAGERHAEQPCRHAADLAFAHRHMRQRLIRHVDAFDQRRDDVARLRPLHRDDRPLLGDRGQPDIEMRELGLEIVLHVVHDARRAAGRRRHMEAVRRQPADDAVIIDEAVLAQHDAIAAAAGLQLLPRIGVEQFHELGRIRPDHLDLAQRRGVEQAGRLCAPSTHSRSTAACMSSPALREIPGALPLADILEHGALRFGPGMDRRLARRVEQRPARMADDRAEGHRRIGRAEGGQADLGDRLAQRLGGNRQAVHVGGLALVGRHAVGGEALDMLDRAHAFMHRLADILGGDVVLEIDKGLDRRVRPGAGRRAQHAARPAFRGIDLRLAPLRRVLGAGILRRLGARRIGLVDRRRQPVGAVAGADRNAILRIGAGHEALGRRR